jgi:hypothetical protein
MEKAEGAPVQSMSPDAEGSDKGQFDLGANLYSPDPAERLQAARSLSPEERKKAVARLRRGCPVRGWPYGMPTVVNPWIVVIGASPGGSPAKDDKWASGSYPAPTVGAAHLGIYYQDVRDYWGKVRELAGSALASQRMRASAGECPEFCVWRPVHAGFSHAHAVKRVSNRIASWLRAAIHSRAVRPSFSKLRMAR